MKSNTYSKEINVFNYGTEIRMEFAEKVDIQIVAETMMEAVRETIGKNGDYVDRWIQELDDCCKGIKEEIECELWSDEFTQIIPSMVKAVAEALPSVTFNGYAIRDDMKCFWIDTFDYSYDGNTLHIKETFMDDENGYFCPECGCFVAYPNEMFEDDEIIECYDCEEKFKATDLKYVAPIVTEKSITIR